MKIRLFIGFCLLVSVSCFAQLQQNVFPDLEGEDLRVAVKENFKPATVLQFSRARDTLFSVVYGRNDSLSCVYTGHTIYLNPNQDPTQAAYLDGSPNGINTEHTYPQAYGAANGNARADMHHLFPTRTPVNTDRNNLPFGEIPDGQTERWYYLNQETGSIPSQNIDKYSEIIETRFEPREDHKGNVARAMFYFYTMYTAEANAANSSYFESQRATFCEWHYGEPVDQEEWDRSWQIASYQDGKPNPFVLDCSLAARLYCPEFEANCQISPTEDLEEVLPFQVLPNAPNPFRTATTIFYSLEKAFDVELKFYNSVGQLLTAPMQYAQAPGAYTISINKSDLNLNAGGYIYYQLELTNAEERYTIPQRMLFLP